MMLGPIHFFAAMIALVSGGLVAMRLKGTMFHRWTGRVYLASMAIMLGTALMIYRLFDGFGPFHWLALVSIALIIAGAVPVYRRRPKKYWIIPHATWMTASYIGLWAAAVAETTTRTLDLDFGFTVIVSSAAVIVGGAIAMRLLLPKAFARFGL